MDIFRIIRVISCRVKNEMLTSERKALILDRIRRNGRLVAKSFAEEIGLSEDTVRRDLREMAAAGSGGLFGPTVGGFERQAEARG